MPYRLVPCHIGKGDQFEDSFLRISPNNRMPALVDDDPPGGGAPGQRLRVRRDDDVHRREGRPLLPAGTCEAATRSTSGSCWQMANQGPKFGERGHFNRLGGDEGDQTYALTRFSNEVNRLYGVMNNRLYDRPYLAGDAYTIADMISYPWTVYWEAQGQDIDEFKYFKRWYEELSAREAVQCGMAGRRRPARRPRHDPGGGEAAPPRVALQPARPPRAGLNVSRPTHLSSCPDTLPGIHVRGL